MISVGLKRSDFWKHKNFRRAAVITILVLSLLPLVNIIHIIATTGANTPSSDDPFFMDRFLGRVLNGTYDWRFFIRDTFFNTHSSVFPAMAYIAFALLTDFNIYSILYFGIILAAIKLVLVHYCFTRLSERELSFASLLLWLALSALIFSASQISIFEHDLQSMVTGFNQLGLALGIWGMTRFPARLAGALVCAAGGMMATLSFGSGPLYWPILLVGLYLLGFRKLAHYAICVVAAALSTFPYVYFILLNPRGSSATGTKSLFNYAFIVDIIGRPMADMIAVTHLPLTMAGRHGALGLVMLAVGLVILWTRRKTAALRQAAPALMFIASSLLSIWQISIFRDSIAPWYTGIAIAFWFGLLGLAYVLWVNRASRVATPSRGNKIISLLDPAWCVAVALLVAVLYAISNLTYTDKSIFLKTRSPASASSVRNYKTAPTYCEGTLVIWPVGIPYYMDLLGNFLERHRLAVFSSHQQWSLQGDFILDTVRVQETLGLPDVWWSADLSARQVPFTDYRHLNLFLHTPNSVSWTVTLPENLRQADFHSAVAVSEGTPRDPVFDGIVFEVYIETEGNTTQAFRQYLGPEERYWHPFTIPLSEHRGKTITLRLTSSGNENIGYDWAMFRYPYIDLHLEESDPVAETYTPRKPSNTELSSRFVQTTPDDLRLDVLNRQLWRVTNLSPQPGPGGEPTAWVVTDQNPTLLYRPPLNARIGDYSHFYIQISTSSDMPKSDEGARSMVKIYYKVNEQAEFHDSISVTIPLLGDGKLHSYSYELKLLEMSKDTRLTGIMIKPAYGPADIGADRIQITDFRLIRASGLEKRLVKGSSLNWYSFSCKNALHPAIAVPLASL